MKLNEALYSSQAFSVHSFRFHVLAYTVDCVTVPNKIDDNDDFKTKHGIYEWCCVFVYLFICLFVCVYIIIYT